MAKKNVELKSGRKIQLKEMSVDDVDYCNDITTIVYDEAGTLSTVRGISKARTAWLRRGIQGGDFKDFSLTGNVVSDGAIKELSESEKNELMQLVQAYQQLGE